jgi:quinol monooxygenase YgiN
MMVTVGLLIRIEAKPDRVPDAEARFKAVVDHVRAEGKAVAWFALRFGPTSYAIMDVFRNESDRDEHLAANFAALRSAGAALFAAEPTVEYVDVVADLLPGI